MRMLWLCVVVISLCFFPGHDDIIIIINIYLFIYLSIYLFIYLFIYGCVGSSFLCEGFL